MPRINGEDIGKFWGKDDLGLNFQDPAKPSRQRYLSVKPDKDRITLERGIFGRTSHYNQKNVVFSPSLENLLAEQLSAKELEYLKIQKNNVAESSATETSRVSVDLLGDPIEEPNPLNQDLAQKTLRSRTSSFGSFVESSPKNTDAIAAAKTVKDLKTSNSNLNTLNSAIQSLAESLGDASLEDRIAVIKHLVN